MHLENSISSRLRIAQYLIENLHADEYIKSINLEKYLQTKRHPIDTKGIHGNFGIMKIIKILENNKIERWGLENIGSEKFKEKFSFDTEKSIKGIVKKKEKSEKIFDFIIYFNNIPIIAIETNFYSTSGTKIGINQGEYTDLIQDIYNYNEKTGKNLLFIWVTDGNYWLTSDGEKRYNNLKGNYFKADHELLNYNLFKEKLPILLEAIKNGE